MIENLPSERKGISYPSVTPGSTSISNILSSVTNLQSKIYLEYTFKFDLIYLIFGHSSQTCS